jgi:hypothetical protein
MRRQEKSRALRSFILIEILVWLSIMAAVSLLMIEMMVSGMRIARQSSQRDMMIGRVDLALTMMRRDAWRAEEIAAAGNQVAMVLPEGVVFWRMEKDNVLTRLDPKEAPIKKAWPNMPAFSFSAKGALLRVDVQSGVSGNRRESTVLASQRMLAGGTP